MTANIRSDTSEFCWFPPEVFPYSWLHSLVGRWVSLYIYGRGELCLVEMKPINCKVSWYIPAWTVSVWENRMAVFAKKKSPRFRFRMWCTDSPRDQVSQSSGLTKSLSSPILQCLGLAIYYICDSVAYHLRLVASPFAHQNLGNGLSTWFKVQQNYSSSL